MKITKKASLWILGVTALVFSRAMFAFIDDPEGPNLLVVIVAAAVIYFISWAISAFFPRMKEDATKSFSLQAFVQALVTVGLYLCLK